ncbi:DUF6082 family protein [Actinoplanes aureus]|uniref:Uncharacterized protein n=1 Tax=Actinoplanes aureus TaxID=2792083 RepID=A0A931G798_9ACTN|nr:DUF6082 family protein [Actinoplanes aureus]MBG0568019.1 hypothetical protein [Actinoplanes aureus]
MRRRTAVTVVATTGLVAAIAFASPAALALADLFWKPDWRHLADIGQAYGVASAIFSALAVAGVAASLVYQARALRLARVQAIRTTHWELLTTAMERPSLFAPAAGLKQWQATTMKPEQFWYATAFVNYWHSAFDAGLHTEASLRDGSLPNFFASELGRQWWTTSHSAKTWRTSIDPVTRRFAQILDEEYAKAAAAGPPLPASAFRPEQPDTPRTEPRTARPPGNLTGTILLGAVATAAMVGWLAGRRR